MDRDRAWIGLKDPDTLQQSIKGCEQVIQHTDTEYEAHFCLKVGPVKRRFQSHLTIIDVKIPEQYNLDCNMNAGMFGEFEGHAEVSLQASVEGCQISYQSRVQIAGWFSALNESVLQSTVDKYMGRFFDRFAEVVSAQAKD